MRSLRSVFVIPRCGVCGKAVLPGEYFCAKCSENLKRITPPLCARCGMGTDRCACGPSSRRSVLVAAPFYYEGHIRQALQGMKFNADFYRVEAFVPSCVQTIQARYPRAAFDAVTFVPMYRTKQHRRGYNQAQLIAKNVAKRLNIPVMDCLVKIRDNPPQHTMSLDQRKANVFGVYAVKDGAEVAGKTILLVDDIATTGNTFEEIAQILKLAGVAKVHCAALALTPPKEK